ncbi:MAG: LD-carboxypeptidase [Bacteroidales bacterium]
MESVISPQFLQKGDTVGIIAPARRIGREELIPFNRFLLNAGLKVVSGHNLFGTEHQLSGTVEERLSDIHQMFTDPSVKAIFSARGGYGAAQLLPGIDWEVVRDNPKWLVGFSDITALHSAVGKFMETIHGVMPYSLMMKEPQDGASVESLLNLLTGKEVHYHPEDHPLNVTGGAEGALTGGNLSVLYSLAGTIYEPEYKGKILFLEDVDEYIYHIDRMILNFDIRDIFRKIAGLVIGDFSGMHDNNVPYGTDPLEIIAERAQKYNVPTLFGFPAGHKKTNFPLIFGRVSTLTVQRGNNSLLMNEPKRIIYG